MFKVFVTPRRDKLGDTLAITSIFGSILETHPDTHFCLWSRHVYDPLIAGYEANISYVEHPVEVGPGYDAMVVMGRCRSTHTRLARAMGIPRIVGKPSLSGLLSGLMRVPPMRGSELHITEQWSLYFKPLFPGSAPPEHYLKLSFPPLDIGQPKQYVLIHHGTGGSNNPPSKRVYAELLAGIAMRFPGLKIVITGDAPDAAIMDAAQGQAMMFAETSLVELGALLRGAAVVISPDTGVAHVAAALDVPMITLFSKAYNPRSIWMPMGAQVHPVESSTPCASCTKTGTCPRRTPPESTCTDGFDVGTILDELGQIVAANAPSGL